ncbi:4'-phosphopantetheinyl transferase superfamily protein [Micromonospora sp. NPDC007271]|uniref:4'-phosphopantetheinyl transferase family protein n=1 Tax=Micromonospora sp. NPDC007271 TaxID=3154587 RepID=UPI0033CE1275
MEWAAVLLSETSGDPRARASGLAVRAVADLLGLPAGEVRLGREPSGRPYALGAGRRVHVSVSHGRGVVAVAAAAHTPIGVDVERERPLPAVPLARRWLAPADAEWLTRQAAGWHPTAFLWLWTQKEAIGKARGTGLRDGGMRQPVPLPAAWPDPVGVLPPRQVPGTDLTVAGGRLCGALVLAVAAAGWPGGAPIRIARVD